MQGVQNIPSDNHDDVIKWNIFRVTGPLCGEFTGPGEFPAQRPVTRSFDVFFDLRPNKDWVNNCKAGDLRRHRGHYDVNVMIQSRRFETSQDLTKIRYPFSQWVESQTSLSFTTHFPPDNQIVLGLAYDVSTRTVIWQGDTLQM